MIGNDIIDLAIAQKHIRVKEERYQKKVLQTGEIKWLEQQTDPILSFHALWAVKEATYKLLSKRYPRQTFSPKKILIHNLSTIAQQDSAYVQAETEKGLYPVILKITSNTLEAFAAQNISTLQRAVFQSILLPNSSYTLQSYHTKLQLKAAVSAFLSIDIEKLKIQKENSIPNLYISEKKAPIDITLSHHGNWGAFGYLC